MKRSTRALARNLAEAKEVEGRRTPLETAAALGFCITLGVVCFCVWAILGFPVW